MSTAVWITEWTLAVLGIWTLASLAAGALWIALVQFLTWRSRHHAGVYGRGWSDL